MAKNSESIEERMERNSIGFEQRKIESKKRMDEHRQSVENKSIENNKPSAPPSQKKKNDLTVKVDIDVSDALKGLKAVQREAKKTARVLREVESTEIFEWEEGIQKLAKRTGTFGLLNDVLVLGRKSLKEVKALNNLTDKELEEYERLLAERYILTHENCIELSTNSYKRIIKERDDNSLLEELARRGIEVEVKNKTQN